MWILIAVILFVAAGILPSFMPKALANTVATWNELASKWARVRTIPTSLILAVIHQESRGNPQAKGSTADYGLMQITASALSDFNKSLKKSYSLLPDMLDPDKNVEVGSWYLVWLKKYLQTDDWKWILRGYNAGPGQAKRDQEAGREPGNYSASVLSFQNKIQSMGA